MESHLNSSVAYESEPKKSSTHRPSRLQRNGLNALVGNVSLERAGRSLILYCLSLEKLSYQHLVVSLCGNRSPSCSNFEQALNRPSSSVVLVAEKICAQSKPHKPDVTPTSRCEVAMPPLTCSINSEYHSGIASVVIDHGR